MVRLSFKSRCFLTLIIISGITSAAFAEEITLIGRATMSPTSTDFSGLTDLQENGTPQNRLGGHGSGIAWLREGNRYVMIPDRGPDDGATSYKCRIQIVEIIVDQNSEHPVTARLLETHLLKAASGEVFVGRATQFDREHPERSLRLDPEGVRVASRGTLLISDEYGPTIREFDLKGNWIRDLPTPTHYQIALPGAASTDELPPNNNAGRQNNRGWEGVGLSTDETKVYSSTQSPLIQDGGLDAKNKRAGTNIRIWEYSLATGATREFLYQLDDPSLGCSDIEAIGLDRLLVLERDSKPADSAKVKRIYEVDLSNASEISSIKSLPMKGTPSGIRPVVKKLFLDLLSAEYGLAGTTFPEKIEGIAIGPRLKNGSRVLIVTSDNDFNADEATELFAFEIRN